MPIFLQEWVWESIPISHLLKRSRETFYPVFSCPSSAHSTFGYQMSNVRSRNKVLRFPISARIEKCSMHFIESRDHLSSCPATRHFSQRAMMGYSPDSAFWRVFVGLLKRFFEALCSEKLYFLWGLRVYEYTLQLACLSQILS
jgi:hypothetical protein